MTWNARISCIFLLGSHMDLGVPQQINFSFEILVHNLPSKFHQMCVTCPATYTIFGFAQLSLDLFQESDMLKDPTIRNFQWSGHYKSWLYCSSYIQIKVLISYNMVSMRTTYFYLGIYTCPVEVSAMTYLCKYSHDLHINQGHLLHEII